ncbi:MAG TPA: FecR domain-containing protein [Agriterribacter sp.]|nr:FecR domain-containing protein [Agriterribacter sp.]
MQSFELRCLLEKYINDTISAEEFKQLWKTLSENQFDSHWHELIGEVLTDARFHGLSDALEASGRLEQINLLIGEKYHIDKHEAMIEEKSSAFAETPVVRFNRYHLLRYAAVIMLVLLSGIYLLTQTGRHNVESNAAQQLTPVNIIKPGTQKAMLTLSDGSVIILDSMASGTIAHQGSTSIVKSAGGQIRYQALEPIGRNRDVTYNTMSTPRGGEYQLTLPDGTNVWLNAESSITYPTSFPGNTRAVVITGEAYFEVIKDKHRPFHVKAGDQEIEVLGTHFNINAYGDDGQIKTSLLEGSVKVNNSVLKPGQAYMNGNIGFTDVDQDVAWKNGIFNFNNQTLAEVMKQLARWYNIEVIYPEGIPKKEYGGEMGRNLTLDQVLNGLESSGVHFQLNERRLIVKL